MVDQTHRPTVGTTATSAPTTKRPPHFMHCSRTTMADENPVSKANNKTMRACNLDSVVQNCEAATPKHAKDNSKTRGAARSKGLGVLYSIRCRCVCATGRKQTLTNHKPVKATEDQCSRAPPAVVVTATAVCGKAAGISGGALRTAAVF